MSNADFQTVKKVSKVLEGFKSMGELLGVTPVVNLAPDALAKWEDLVKKHDAFYDLDINDRLVFAEIGGVPREPAAPSEGDNDA